jgi:hypothetical protein
LVFSALSLICAAGQLYARHRRPTPTCREMVSPESFLSFSGVIVAAFSPALVLLFTVVTSQPVLIILSVFAAFLWLCAITVVAGIWWVLVPARGLLWLLVLYAVVAQEICRYATYSLFQRLMSGLHAAGLLRASTTQTAAQVVPPAISSGLGAGIMQVLIMYGDVLGGSLLPGTLYSRACSGLSVFAVDALLSCAFIVLNVLLSFIGWTTAYPRGDPMMHAAIVMLHLLASGSTLLIASPFIDQGNGCGVALPLLYAVVLLAALLAAKVASTSMCIARKPSSPPDPSGGRADGGIYIS